MADRGRKSAASLVVASPTSLQHRLAPPPYLTPAQKAYWVAVVNSKPADWFSDEHELVLAQLCRHKVTSDVIAQQQEAYDPAWLTDDEGLKRFAVLARCQETETRAICALMRAMRLTHQSLIRADKAVGRTGTGRKPWQIEND